MDGISIFEQARTLINKLAASFSEEQLFTIPNGFDNNIAWNLGHIAVVQQSLIYRLSGLPSMTNKTHYQLFKTGTSPADWSEPPDMSEIKSILKETMSTLRTDYQNKAFTNFQPYTTSTRFVLNTIEESIAFNNFHEGLHLGAILAINNFL